MTDARFTDPELQALYALLAPTDTGAPRAPLLKTSPPARAEPGGRLGRSPPAHHPRRRVPGAFGGGTPTRQPARAGGLRLRGAQPPRRTPAAVRTAGPGAGLDPTGTVARGAGGVGRCRRRQRRRDRPGLPHGGHPSVPDGHRPGRPAGSSARPPPGSPGRWRPAGPGGARARPPTRAPPRDLPPTRRRSATTPCPASPAGRRGRRPCRRGRRCAGCRRSTAPAANRRERPATPRPPPPRRRRGDPVDERHLQVTVEAGVEGGGLDAAPPVRVLGVESMQADERGQLRRITRRGKLQQAPRGHRQTAVPLRLALQAYDVEHDQMRGPGPGGGGCAGAAAAGQALLQRRESEASALPHHQLAVYAGCDACLIDGPSMRRSARWRKSARCSTRPSKPGTGTWSGLVQREGIASSP